MNVLFESKHFDARIEVTRVLDNLSVRYAPFAGWSSRGMGYDILAAYEIMSLSAPNESISHAFVFSSRLIPR